MAPSQWSHLEDKTQGARLRRLLLKEATKAMRDGQRRLLKTAKETHNA